MDDIIRETINEINLKSEQLNEIEQMLKMLNKIKEEEREWSIKIRTLPGTLYESEAINQWKLLPILIDYFENCKIEAEAYLTGMLVK